MATITLEYNPRTKRAAELLTQIYESGVFKVSTKTKEPKYNPEFVKMILEADAGPKTRVTLEELKVMMGL